MPIPDYAPLAPDNVTISGIGIAEGCSPGNLNDAIRQLMADLSLWHSEVTEDNSRPVTGAQLQDGTITGDKLAQAAVTGDRIAPGAISPAHIAGAAVTGPALAPDAVTAAAVAPGEINGRHLADAAVSSAKIAPGAVLDAHLGERAVPPDKIRVAHAIRTLLGSSSPAEARTALNAVSMDEVIGKINLIVGQAIAGHVTDVRLGAPVTTPENSAGHIPTGETLRVWNQNAGAYEHMAVRRPIEVFRNGQWHGISRV